MAVAAMVWMAMGSDFVLVQGGGVRMVLGSGVKELVLATATDVEK